VTLLATSVNHAHHLCDENTLVRLTNVFVQRARSMIYEKVGVTDCRCQERMVCQCSSHVVNENASTKHGLLEVPRTPWFPEDQGGRHFRRRSRKWSCRQGWRGGLRCRVGRGGLRRQRVYEVNLRYTDNHIQAGHEPMPLPGSVQEPASLSFLISLFRGVVASLQYRRHDHPQ
jgi:hypothetical protein